MHTLLSTVSKGDCHLLFLPSSTILEKEEKRKLDRFFPMLEEPKGKKSSALFFLRQFFSLFFSFVFFFCGRRFVLLPFSLRFRMRPALARAFVEHFSPFLRYVCDVSVPMRGLVAGEKRSALFARETHRGRRLRSFFVGGAQFLSRPKK